MCGKGALWGGSTAGSSLGDVVDGAFVWAHVQREVLRDALALGELQCCFEETSPEWDRKACDFQRR